jgi:hypothetical protein
MDDIQRLNNEKEKNYRDVQQYSIENNADRTLDIIAALMKDEQ